MKRLVNIYGSNAPLRKVLVHRPSNEILNITCDNYQKLGFRDIPDLKLLQKEHDAYSNQLRNLGVDVVNLIDLVVDSLNYNINIREKFIKQFIKEAGINIDSLYNQIYDLLNSIKDNRKLISKCIEGISVNEINLNGIKFYQLNSDFIILPLANLYQIANFVTCIGSGIVLSKSSVKNRESIFIEYIYKYHPKYKNVSVYYDRYENANLDCKDIIVLNKEVLCVGISSNTEYMGINKLIQNIKEESFKYILLFDLTKCNSSLSDVFTLIDDDKFLIDKKIISDISCYEVCVNNLVLNPVLLRMSFENIMCKYLHLESISLIDIENSVINYKREFLSFYTNALCVNFNVLMTYSKNYITNELLKYNGVLVNEINASQLLLGKNGIKSLGIPLLRD